MQDDLDTLGLTVWDSHDGNFGFDPKTKKPIVIDPGSIVPINPDQNNATVKRKGVDVGRLSSNLSKKRLIGLIKSGSRREQEALEEHRGLFGQFGITDDDHDRVNKKITNARDSIDIFKKALHTKIGLRYDQGGPVHGGGMGDTVDAKLTAGEFVLNRRAVHRIGKDKLHAMNGRKIKKFAQGGPVGFADGRW